MVDGGALDIDEDVKWTCGLWWSCKVVKSAKGKGFGGGCLKDAFKIEYLICADYGARRCNLSVKPKPKHKRPFLPLKGSNYSLGRLAGRHSVSHFALVLYY